MAKPLSPFPLGAGIALAPFTGLAGATGLSGLIGLAGFATFTGFVFLIGLPAGKLIQKLALRCPENH